MNKMRVCIAPNSMGQGGIGTALTRLSHGLLECGLDVDFVLTAPPEKDFGRLQNLDDRVRVFRFGKRTLSSLPSIRRYLRDEQPDFVITAHNPVFVAFVLVSSTTAVGTKPRIFHQIQTHRSVDLPKKGSLGQFHDWMMRMLIRRAASVVGVSSGVARDFECGVGLSRGSVRVIPNAIDNRSFHSSESKPHHPWFQEKSLPILLAVGRLTEQKDYPTLLAAFARVVASTPCRLVILGSGEAESELREKTESMGIAPNVWFVGHVADPKPFFFFSDIFVSSSAWEGMPVAHLEALAAGLPVVCTDCPSGPAEILAGGRYGSLVPVGDSEALADAIEGLLKSDSQAELLKQRAEDYSEVRITQMYIDLFGEFV